MVWSHHQPKNNDPVQNQSPPKRLCLLNVHVSRQSQLIQSLKNEDTEHNRPPHKKKALTNCKISTTPRHTTTHTCCVQHEETAKTRAGGGSSEMSVFQSRPTATPIWREVCVREGCVPRRSRQEGYALNKSRITVCPLYAVNICYPCRHSSSQKVMRRKQSKGEVFNA